MLEPEKNFSFSEMVQNLRNLISAAYLLIKSEAKLFLAQKQYAATSWLTRGVIRTLFLILGLFIAFFAVSFLMVALVFALQEWLNFWALSFLASSGIIFVLSALSMYFAFRSAPKKQSITEERKVS